MLSSNLQSRKLTRLTAVAVGLSLVAILLMGGSPGGAVPAATTYDNVQILIHTTNSTFTGTYTVTAYNSTGYAVITYTTPYPAAAFELPSASYIFSVSADSNGFYACPLVTPVSSGASVSSASATSATVTASGGASSGSSGGTAIIVPPCYKGVPESEYGFAVQQVSGPTTITVSTTPVDSFPTTTVTVHVQYVNGTAAAGTQVYADVLGGQWYGIYTGYAPGTLGGGSVLNMSGVVGSNGIAKLVVPAAPVEVTAWNWVHVPQPVSHSPVVVNIGGEKVNVTVNWEPTFLGLAGSVLIVPPQTSGSITLHAEQPNFWATPEGVATASAGAASSSAGLSTPATVSNSPDLVPASITSQQSSTASGAAATQTVVSTSTVVETVPARAGGTPSLTTGGSSYSTVLLTVVGAFALAIASASLILVRRRAGA